MYQMIQFPKNPALKAQWEKQVQRTRANWKASENSYLCSEHFTPESFEVDFQLAAQFGIKKRRRLKPDAVLSIFPRVAIVAMRKRESSGSDRASASKRKRGAVEKRKRQ